jgi:hypothetical protein
MEGMGEISFLAVLSILVSPIALFLIAHLLYPTETKGSDLEAYYFRQAPLLWGLVIAGTIVGTFIEQLLLGQPVFHPSNLSGIPMILLCSVLVVSKRRRVHSILTPVILLMVFLDTILANPAISAG